jgi:hypothetical protein
MSVAITENKAGSEIDSKLSPEQKKTLQDERHMFFEKMQKRHGGR